jgi:hypothetical protein
VLLSVSVLNYEGGPNFKVQHEITTIYLLQKEVFKKVEKHYILIFFSDMVAVSTRTLIQLFYKFKHSKKFLNGVKR